MSVSIARAVLHILDTTVGVPVLSQSFMTLSEELREYMEKHVLKCYNDADLKKTKFISQDGFFFKLMQEYQSQHDLMKASVPIAEFFYRLTAENSDIPPCDMLFIEANVFNKDYFVILKLNYKRGYIHYTKEEEGTRNIIIEQPCALPSATQKIDEVILIETDSLNVWVKEKKCQVYDEPCYYISKHVLGCREEKKDREKVKIISDTADKIIKEFYDDDMFMKSKVKNIIRENVEENLNIDLNKITEEVFPDEDVKKAYTEEVKVKGIKEPEVKVNFNYANKIKTKQKIVTDEGIEISIPYEMLNDKNKVEFITNHDGTISIVLKNIDSIVDK